MTSRTALWLLGDARIGGSPSPLLHNALFGDDRYQLHPDDDAGRAFAAAEAAVRGVNVTAPHKVKAFDRYKDVADDRAAACGAVNTVVYGDDGRAERAANTDVHGAMTAWRRAGLLIENRVVGVIGAGGAARAVVVAAKEAGASAVVVHARRRDAAAGIVALAARIGLDAAVADAAIGGALVKDAGRANKASVVVVAAADLDGVDGWLDRALLPGGAVHDLRYGARAHAVRNAALSRKALFVDGSSMLLAQAEEAAALFQGRPLDDGQRRVMSAALAAWLRRPR